MDMFYNYFFAFFLVNRDLFYLSLKESSDLFFHVCHLGICHIFNENNNCLRKASLYPVSGHRVFVKVTYFILVLVLYQSLPGIPGGSL